MRRVEQFVGGVCRMGEKAFDEPRVARYVGEDRVDPASLTPFLFWEPTHYTRSLIYKCDLFELMAICWDVGQVSRIHNHAGQRCWMSVPIGRLAVQNYEIVSLDQARGSCELREADRVEMDPDHPSYVDREK